VRGTMRAAAAALLVMAMAALAELMARLVARRQLGMAVVLGAMAQIAQRQSPALTGSSGLLVTGKMWKRILLFAGLLASPCYAGQDRNAQVYVNLSATGYTIPSKFVGLSAEVGDLIFGFYQGPCTGAVGSWAGVANLLGRSGSFRLGGNSSDGLVAPALTSGIATNLATFMTCLGASWSLIYGLPLQINNPTTANTQAGLIATAMGGGANVVFQFGNESIGNYVTKAQYETNWNSYYTTINGSIAGLLVAAADTEDFGDTQSVIAALTPGISGMSYVTLHWYGGYNGNPYTVSSASQLISTVPINYWQNANTGNSNLPYIGYDLNNRWAQNNSVKLRLSESNSINSLGITGYSNTLMSATWYLNQAITFANMGWDGINTHNAYGHGTGNGNGIYNPIVSKDGGKTYQAAPEFYGLYLFSMIENQQTVAVSRGGNANINAIATVGGNGNANILIVNNDPSNNSVVTPGQSSAWTTATVLLLSGTSCADAAPTLGGSIIGPGGAYSGVTTSLASGASVSIPPCGAALIEIQP
jgi:hypothetical protein